MKNVFKKIDGVKTGLFAAGVLFGTAGIKVLASDDAKKLYANCTAAVTCKEVRYEDSNKHPGKCRRYICRS